MHNLGERYHEGEISASKYPTKVLLLTGKRKSGKDYIADELIKRIGPERGVVVRLSAPIKSHWARKLGLDLEALLGSGQYKESHRKDMICWGEEMRAKDYGYFCQAAVEGVQASKWPVWVVSDARRQTDLLWFREKYGAAVRTVRVQASDDVRMERGWVFTAGVDDAPSECDLDCVSTWDWVITNNGDGQTLQQSLTNILGWVCN